MATDPNAAIYDALRKADAAGDAEAVGRLSQYLKEQPAAAETPAPAANVGQVRTNADGSTDQMGPDGQWLVKTGPPAPEDSLARRAALFGGDLVQGAGDVFGLAANPINAALNLTGLPKALIGEDLSTDYGATARGAVGAPNPVTDQEKLASAINRGGAGALATGGVGAALGGTSGVLGMFGESLAGNPVRNFIAGLGSGAGAELGDRVGGTPGAIIGGGAGLLAAGASATAAERLGRGAYKIGERLAEHFPRSVMVNDAGHLTEDGIEIAQRTGADMDAVRETYARARTSGLRQRSGNTDREAVRSAITPEQRAAAASVRQPEQAPAPAPQGAPLEARTNAILGGIRQRVAEVDAAATPYQEAQSEGVRLSRGQAEQNFEVQNDENSLRVSTTREGEQARQFFQQQQQHITSALDRFRQSFGPDAGNATDRGQVLKEALTTLRDSGAAGVRALYRQAEELGGEGLKLETEGIKDASTDVLMDEAISDQVKRAVSQELARYGIIGDAAPMNEAGITKVTLDDGSSVQFRGAVKDLTASNAEDMRQAINRLYDPTKPNLSGQSIKPAIDDALERAIETAAGGEGQIGDAYRTARQAYQDQRRTFNAKDIVDNLIANKKGTNTPVVLPERAIAQTLGSGKQGVTNIRKVKALLLSGGQPEARQAWGAIQHQAVADIFDSALARNVNHGNGHIGDVVSGAKLNSAIEKFGVVKLREVLDEDDFNQIMKLRRIIGHATIPISGTVNPSGTATKLINYMKSGTLRFAGKIPGIGAAGHAVAGLIAKGKEIAATQKTLQGITSYDGRIETSRRLDQQARDFVREYVDAGKAGKFVPKALNLSSQSGTSKR